MLVRQMAKKLAARYAKTRRRRLRGQLDTRRTLRRNMGWGGIPFITVWKQKRIEKPRVMVLCDVSGSVAAMSGFLLMFLYALNEALSDIRSFAFAGSLIEVSEILEKEPVEQAISKIMQTIGYGSSNYGNSFSDFEDGWMQFVNNKTTVIILGDGRGNRTDPRTDVIGRLSQRCKRIIWLNPEYRSAWGTGDSGHVSLRAVLQPGDGVQHAAASGARDHRYSGRRGVGGPTPSGRTRVLVDSPGNLVLGVPEQGNRVILAEIDVAPLGRRSLTLYFTLISK